MLGHYSQGDGDHTLGCPVGNGVGLFMSLSQNLVRHSDLFLVLGEPSFFLLQDLVWKFVTRPAFYIFWPFIKGNRPYFDQHWEIGHILARDAFYEFSFHAEFWNVKSFMRADLSYQTFTQNFNNQLDKIVLNSII